MLKRLPVFLITLWVVTGCNKPASGPIGSVGIDLPPDDNTPVVVNPTPASSSSTTSPTVTPNTNSPQNDTSTTTSTQGNSFFGFFNPTTSTTTSSTVTTSTITTSTVTSSTLSPVTTTTVSTLSGRDPSSQPTVKVFSAPVLMLRNVGQQYQTPMTTAPGN